MTAILVSTDTAPTINGTISNSEGVVDLTGCDVFFQLRLASEQRWRINAAATIAVAAEGTVTYDLATDDLDFFGDCLARFLVIWPDDTRQHTTPAIEVTVQQQ